MRKMKWEQIKGLKAADFRRLTGVKRGRFDKMVEWLSLHHQKKKARGGRQNTLRVEEMLLMTLEYLREYRTYFHISQSYGISESYAYKIIRWVEDCLIKTPLFHLPGRKALLKSDVEYEVVLVDASETPVQRPKKSSAIITQARKSATR